MKEKETETYKRAMKVLEVFSPPRVTKVDAEEYGIKSTQAIDIKCVDKRDLRRWDLNDPEMVRRLWRYIETEHPEWIIGSPECTALPTLQNLSNGKGTTEQGTTTKSSERSSCSFKTHDGHI